MSNASILATLNKLANANPKRPDFNRAVRQAFPQCLGHGAFRSVYAAGDMVVKIRRSRSNGSGFRMSDIQKSNVEEAENYNDVLECHPLFANFVMPLTYYTLPNGHDAVLMRRAEKTWSSMRQSFREHHEVYDTLIGRQYRIISNCFQDSHWGNIGILGNRLFLIDINQGFHGKDWLDDFTEMATNVLTELGVIGKSMKAAS